MSVVTVDLSSANPKQLAFFAADKPYIAYGGARGGGKSWAVRAKAIMDCLQLAGIRILIVRRTLDELRENHILPIRDIMGKAVRYSEREKKMTFPNGSVIIFGYCDAERDCDRYKGQEYDEVFLDEATTLTEYQYQTFKGCIRGVNSFPKHLYVTCNPDGVGMAWVKRLWIDRDFREGEDPEDFEFIQALVTDNKALMEADPGYIKQLDALPFALREAWRYGKWDSYAGQMFAEWDRNVHVCQPEPIPEHWRRYAVMDYGMDMLAAFVIAVDEQGGCTVLRELYEGRDLGDGHEGLPIWAAAERVKEMIGEDRIYTFLAPPDMWNGRQETGKSVADIFAEYGIYLTKTSNERIAGWLAVHELLRVREDEQGLRRSKLRIFANCVNLIRTLPLLRYDEHRPGDAAGEPHEITHAPDALRYFADYWISAAESPQERPKKKLIDVLNQRNKRRHRR